MRSVQSASLLMILALVPAQVGAQPSDPPPLYVCTPDGQVLRVDGNSGATSVLYSLAGASFDDCVLGPDGRLYISNGTEIRRLTPGAPAPGDAESIATVGSAARGLAFNVSDLYVATTASGVQRLPGASQVPFGGGPIAPVAGSSLAAAGRGVAFDVVGNLVAAVGGNIQSFAPSYTAGAGAQWSTAAGAPRGIAVNTCGEVVFADRNSKTIRRRAANGTVSTISGIAFGNKDLPIYLEIDSGNRIYIVTAEDDAGSNAKVWRATVPFGTEGNQCAAATSLQGLVNLKSSLSGPASQRVANLLTARALGIAAGPTDYAITRSFTPEACSSAFNFGYHTVAFSFDHCGLLPPDGFNLTVKAVKSTTAQVEFSGAFVPAPPETIEGMRYSPMGGYIVQYVLQADSAPPSPFMAKYSFFTQEAIARPGVAKESTGAVAATYDQDVGTDYWDLVGFGIDPAGERGNHFSKRVVYNAGLARAGVFTGFEEPLNTGNPLFKQGQTVKIAFRVVDVSGRAVNGGDLRVSVVRIDLANLPVQPVTSSAQQDNRMSALGNGKYAYNLNTTAYAPGTYQITIWGNILPINGENATAYTGKVFTIQQ